MGFKKAGDYNIPMIYQIGSYFVLYHVTKTVSVIADCYYHDEHHMRLQKQWSYIVQPTYILCI